jgi:hypothetical protein
MKRHFAIFKHAATGSAQVTWLEHLLMLCIIAFAVIVSANSMLENFS